MKVILTENVSFLGSVGEKVNVSSGHARNYLIPRKLAVLADEANQRQLDDQTRRLNKKISEQKVMADELKGKIDGLNIELFKKVGGNGKLFGSVTNGELAKELEKHGIVIERRIINIDTPIKNLGDYDIKVKLFTDVEASFKVKVAIDPKQAEELRKRQIASEKKAKERKKAEEAKAANPEENAEENGEENIEENAEESIDE
ncbi:MAG: 50S ribosomal protein L9 [Bacteriovoracaceae bacterium]|nr:50S ribosomal protein L9 [Bacteriovoracaceae bacterium]